jgi:hypothetical protein
VGSVYLAAYAHTQVTLLAKEFIFVLLVIYAISEV